MFVTPPRELYTQGDAMYANGHATYTSYNYFGNSLVSRIKLMHFDVALKLTRHLFHRASVIDMGCADGIFLPSAARYFPKVLAIDRDASFVAVANRLVQQCALSNVEVMCNANRSWDELPNGYDAAFLLESLEHIGVASDLYGSKIEFLRGLFSLLKPHGMIVITVPTMVGIPFLIQRIALASLGLRREPIGTADFLRALVLGKTDRLEAAWTNTAHIGFNHRKLRTYLKRNFEVTEDRSYFFFHAFVIKRSPTACKH